IARVGPAVPFWQEGQRVVLLAGSSCGVCRHCVSGGMKACLSPLVMGQNYDGSWAEYVVVHFGVLVALPEHIPFEQAALMPDAVGTRTPDWSIAAGWAWARPSACGASADSACTRCRPPAWPGPP